MPVCKSGIDQKNKKQSGKLKVSLSAPSSKGKPTLCNRLTPAAPDRLFMFAAVLLSEH